MSDKCAHCGSDRVSLFRDGKWFCRRSHRREYATSIFYRVICVAEKLCGPFACSIDTDTALAKLEALADSATPGPGSGET